MGTGEGRGYYNGSGSRGHYRVGQFDRSSPPRKRSWFTIAAVLGLGATAAWLFWPRKAAHNLGPVSEPERAPQPSQTSQTSVTSPLVVINTVSAPATPSTSIATSPTGGFLKQLEDDARANGFISVKDYEDSVILNAKQLQATGTKVVLAPHLQHLAPRLFPG